MRFIHEAKLSPNNCFFTLTYSDENLPPHGSLRMDDVSSFIKRLRSRVAPVRFRFHVKSEYGPTTFRPHYHGIFFGFDFEDRQLIRTTEAGEPSYFSKLLSDAWGLGHCECSDLTPKSAGYVANHNIDKLNGSMADDFYRRLDPETGELVEVEHESQRCSNRPGIGAGWIDRFEVDCFPSGFLIRENGGKIAVPPYYKRRLKGRFSLAGSRQSSLIEVDDYRVMSSKAKAQATTPEAVANSTPERLEVREEVAWHKVKRLKRDAL